MLNFLIFSQETLVMQIIYVDMDDVLCDYTQAYQEAIKRTPAMKYPQSQFGFFVNLQPIEGAIASFQKLIASPDVEPYILTAPSIENPLCYTEKRIWVEQHLGFEVTNKLIICSNKGLLRGDKLIDDWTYGRGQENFDGEIVEFGSTNFPSWKEVNKHLNI